jgi:tripartite-type tricarboxylate transporter receptor subunit TctC
VKNVGYDPITSFEPVAKITDSIQLLVVKSDFPAKSVQEFVALARKEPGKLSYSSAGAGNLTHLSGELFKLRSGTDLVHVPYKSTGEAAAAILGGQVQLTFGGISILLPLIRDGQLKALAITGAVRAPELPDVPTMIESGFPGFVVTSFFGIVAPAKTQAAILEQLNAAINGGLNTSDMKAKFANLGMEPTIGSRQDFAAFIAAELSKWTELAKSSGISID